MVFSIDMSCLDDLNSIEIAQMVEYVLVDMDLDFEEYHDQIRHLLPFEPENQEKLFNVFCYYAFTHREELDVDPNFFDNCLELAQQHIQ